MKREDCVVVPKNVTFTVVADGEEYECTDLERAYEIFDWAERATLTVHWCIDGICGEQVVLERR